MRTPDLVWHNWARNQRCAPSSIEHPGSDAELAAVLKQAAATARRIKVVGAGHSFTDIACTDGVLVQLDHYGRIMSIDPERATATVQAGIPLAELNGALAARGLGLENLGDIAYQSVAGAISTGTHGTGARLRGLAAQVIGLDLLTADGSMISCSADEEPEIFAAARVGLGALGVVSTVTLQCVPAFNLRAVEEPMRLDDVLADFDALAGENDHFEFYWVPHTGWALTKRNNRTDAPVDRSRVNEFVSRTLMENVAFGTVCRLGRLRPSWIPALSKLMKSGGRNEYVERSYRVFTSPRLVHFYEMEYAVPRQSVVEVLRRLTAWVNDSGLTISFPVEVRVAAADDILLSTAASRDSAYIAVHVYWGMPYEQYFRGVEAIMDSVEGRPHWGKMHYQTAETLAPRYPHWQRFQAVRSRLDPEARFANAYTGRVLGPVG